MSGVAASQEERQHAEYLKLFLDPVLKCKAYRPKFGNSKKQGGYSLGEFEKLYGTDPFYSWIGLDTELMYAAHRAAGGMTSVYRQIGIGCEYLFRRIVFDSAQYEDPALAEWSYTSKTQAGKEKTLSLDARLELASIRNKAVETACRSWIAVVCKDLGVVTPPANGAVFEVRQGYKSKDSKRQNADIDNAAVAWASKYLPVFAVFSVQIDHDIVLRYRNSRCGVLIGKASGTPYESIYEFSSEILKFDLSGFFKSNSATIREAVSDVLETLLGAS